MNSTSVLTFRSLAAHQRAGFLMMNSAPIIHSNQGKVLDAVYTLHRLFSRMLTLCSKI